MATLKAKETGGSDSSNLSSSLPNDTDFSVNWEVFGSNTSYTRDSARIDAPANLSGICLNIGSLGLSDVEIRVTGFDMVGTSGNTGIYLEMLDTNSGGSENGYGCRFQPNRAATSAKWKLHRSDSGTDTDLDNTAESGWSNTSGETVDIYMRFDGSTATARCVQSAQSLDDTLSASDSTYAFGTGASQIDHIVVFSNSTNFFMATIELWDMSAGSTGTPIHYYRMMNQ